MEVTANKSTDEACDLHAELCQLNETLVLPAQCRTTIRSELASCEQFLSVLKLEKNLDACLMGKSEEDHAFNTVVSSVDGELFMGIDDPNQLAAARRTQ